jgi:predicted DNA-binding transcriptional regulator AlpA
MTTASVADGDPDYANRLINEQEAANFLGFSVRALQNWRLRGGGPEYVRVSRRSVRYRRRDLIAWANDRLEAHTSAARSDARGNHPAAQSSEGTARRAQSAEREQQAANTVEARQAEPAPEERVKSPFDVFTDWAR